MTLAEYKDNNKKVNVGCSFFSLQKNNIKVYLKPVANFRVTYKMLHFTNAKSLVFFFFLVIAKSLMGL